MFVDPRNTRDGWRDGPDPGSRLTGPAQRSRQRVIAPILIAVSIALAAAAAGTILITSRDDDPGLPPTPASAPARPTTTIDAGVGDTDKQPLQEPSRNAMRTEIRTLLVEHHRRLTQSQFRSAWALLSQRKRAQNLEKSGGYPGWVKDQSTIAPHLSPDGLRVQILDLDEPTGVARVRVTGMDYADADAPCTTFSGITWVKHELGAWRYDPGYATTKPRKLKWERRFTELLGAKCSG